MEQEVIKMTRIYFLIFPPYVLCMPVSLTPHFSSNPSLSYPSPLEMPLDSGMCVSEGVNEGAVGLVESQEWVQTRRIVVLSSERGESLTSLWDLSSRPGVATYQPGMAEPCFPHVKWD